MKKIILLLVLVFQFFVYSQKNYSLNCKQLNDKAMSVYLKNPKLAAALLKQAELKSKIENSNELYALTNNNLAILLRMKGEFLESKALSLNALKQAIKIETKASIYNNIAACDRSLGIYNESIKFYLLALKIYENKKDIKRQATVINNIGMVFSALEEFDKAKQYHKNALKLFNKINDDKGLSESYNNLAISLANQDSLIQAMTYFRKSLKIEYKLKDQKGIAESLNNVGQVHYYLNVKDSALYYYKKSADIEFLMNNFSGVSESYNNIAMLLIENKELQKGKKYLDSAYSFSLKSKTSEITLTSLLNYVNYYEKIGDFSTANKKLRNYFNLKDSVQNLKKIKNINELETKYQTAKKEKLIIQKEDEAKKRNQLILGLALFSVLIGVIGFLIYRQQKLKNKQQTQAFELKQAINQIETQNKLQSQRLAISKDLHDNIGAQLTFIISSVETAKFAPEVENTKLGNKLTQISEFTKDTIVELRDTIWAMNSSEIGFDDLQIRISNFIEKANNAIENINFKFEIDNSLNQTKLTSIVGMNIYRTIQEAVNNALKYAKATEISVAIEKTKNNIKIEIVDNGIGFDKDSIIQGNGLQNMQKRIEEINGNFEIKSESEKGTKISIVI